MVSLSDTLTLLISSKSSEFEVCSKEKNGCRMEEPLTGQSARIQVETVSSHAVTISTLFHHVTELPNLGLTVGLCEEVDIGHSYRICPTQRV